MCVAVEKYYMISLLLIPMILNGQTQIAALTEWIIIREDKCLMTYVIGSCVAEARLEPKRCYLAMVGDRKLPYG